MKERIRQVMESQHMTQQTFASFIGMSPASLSSIFNDRTKPTINIVEAIKSKIPSISTDWLLFGKGSMYESGSPALSSDANPGDDSSPYQTSSGEVRRESPQTGESKPVQASLDFGQFSISPDNSSANDASLQIGQSFGFSKEATPSEYSQKTVRTPSSDDRSPIVDPSVLSRALLEAQQVIPKPRKVVEIRVFYDDKTWESFFP